MKIVLVGGCFDVLHFGHIVFLQKARSLGDKLVVALESDESVKKLKGKYRPVHSQEQRKMMLESLRYVDVVVSLPYLKNEKEYEAMVKKIHPHFIACTKGDPKEKNKRKMAKMIGAECIVLPKIQNPSTSILLSEY